MVASLGLFRKLLWESRDVLVARILQVVVAWLLIRLSACVEAGIFTAPTLISIQNNSNTSTTAVKLWMAEIEEQQSFGYCPGVRQLVLLSDNDPEQLGMANNWMKDQNLSSYFSFCWLAINQILCNYAHCFAFAHRVRDQLLQVINDSEAGNSGGLVLHGGEVLFWAGQKKEKQVIASASTKAGCGGE